MKDINIYLISGKARHGKTSTANYIRDYFSSVGLKSVVTSYAKYIKMFAMELTDWNGSDDDKPRELLQTLGCEVIREKLGKEDFFIKRLDDDIDVYSEFVSNVIIDDARLPIEIDYFKNKYPMQVKSIKVIRPNFENNLTNKEQNHSTELALDEYSGFDYIIYNDGTLDDIKDKIFDLMKRS